MTEIIVITWLTVLSAYSLLARWEIMEQQKRIGRLIRRISSLKGVTSANGDPESRNFHNHTVLIFDEVDEVDDEET